MTDDLKTVFQGAIDALKADPKAGIGTAVTTTRLRHGVTCDIEDGHWRLVADEMPGDGGEGLGPDPGVFGRAALGSCLAMGYMMFASIMDVQIEELEVVVEADYDAHGLTGVDENVPPGWLAVRYRVDVRSPSPEARVREVIERADRYSSILDVFRRPLDVSRELTVRA